MSRETARASRLSEAQKLFDQAHCINQVVRLAMQAEMINGPSYRMEVANMAEARIKQLAEIP